MKMELAGYLPRPRGRQGFGLALWTAAALLLLGCANDAAAPPRCDGVTNHDCFVGEVFAECPGPVQPAAFCSPHGDCLWVSNGCPLPDRPIPLTEDCSCDGPLCISGVTAAMASFFIGWGDQPWDRQREMNLTVSSPYEGIGGAAAVVCENCIDGCERPNNPCGQTMIYAYQRQMGTHLVRFSAGPGLGGWTLHLEIDGMSSPPRARLCKIPYTDVPTCSPGTPACAASGEVRLESAPLSETEVHGDFSAAFADGSTISGVF